MLFFFFRREESRRIRRKGFGAKQEPITNSTYFQVRFILDILGTFKPKQSHYQGSQLTFRVEFLVLVSIKCNQDFILLFTHCLIGRYLFTNIVSAIYMSNKLNKRTFCFTSQLITIADVMVPIPSLFVQCQQFISCVSQFQQTFFPTKNIPC